MVKVSPTPTVRGLSFGGTSWMLNEISFSTKRIVVFGAAASAEPAHAGAASTVTTTFTRPLLGERTKLPNATTSGRHGQSVLWSISRPSVAMGSRPRVKLVRSAADHARR